MACLLACLTSAALAAEEEGFQPLFNGRDLTGWVNANCAPETWTVRDGMIHCTGHPTGALRTERQYENFILEVEWRHLSAGGNSGVFLWGTPIAAPGVPFLRGIEVQVLDHGYEAKGKGEYYTTHGDVFPIHGATMKPFGRHNGMRSFPSGEFSKGSPEWNHYRVVCTNGVVRHHVNGHEVSGGEDCNYRQGYLALESEGAPVDFRNLRIRELPSSDPAPDLIAPAEPEWRPLFTGLDLRGWKAPAAVRAGWQAAGERLRRHGPETAPVLWTEAAFQDMQFIVDCKPARGSVNPPAPALAIRGSELPGCLVRLPGAEPDRYTRFRITVRDREVVVERVDKDKFNEISRASLPPEAPAKGGFGLAQALPGTDWMNLYARPLPKAGR